MLIKLHSKKLLSASVSIAIALSLSACGGSDIEDLKKISDYEDCKAYSEELAQLAADAFAQALEYTDQDEAMPYLDKAQAYNDIIVENDAECEAILE